MLGFLTAVYRLVPFGDRLSLAVFPLRFFYSVAFSLAVQYFQIPVYQVFFVAPPIDGTPAWHLQPTKGTGDPGGPGIIPASDAGLSHNPPPAEHGKYYCGFLYAYTQNVMSQHHNIKILNKMPYCFFNMMTI